MNIVEAYRNAIEQGKTIRLKSWKERRVRYDAKTKRMRMNLNRGGENNDTYRPSLNDIISDKWESF